MVSTAMTSASQTAAKCGGHSLRAALATAAVALGNAHRRLLMLVLRLVGPRPAYNLMARLARRLYDLADETRDSSEVRCRAALGDRRAEVEIQGISRLAFVHRIWNMVDLMLAPRFLRPETCDRYGGRVPEPYLSLLLQAQQRRQPVILVTTYYGPYDLLPVFLGLNGIRATAVYRPHPNRDYDRYRQSVRTSTGCGMLTASGAALNLSEILAAGQAIALLADPNGARHGVPISFLGESTTAPRTVGLLAERHGAIVAVAAIRRLAEPFQFQLVISDLFGPNDWRDQADVIEYITRRYCAALEKVIFEGPEQYLWLHRRAAFAKSAASDGEDSGEVVSRGSDDSASRALAKREE